MAATVFARTVDAFDVLAQPENAGKAFMIMEEAWVKEFGNDPGNVPWPHYAHRIVRDTVSGHFICERPDSSGIYFKRDWNVFEVVRCTSTRAEELAMEEMIEEMADEVAH